MEAFAYVKFVRMSPRKVKLVCDMIRGQDVKTATAYLSQTSKAACEPMAKLLKSAVANAEHNHRRCQSRPHPEARPHCIPPWFCTDQ